MCGRRALVPVQFVVDNCAVIPSLILANREVELRPHAQYSVFLNGYIFILIPFLRHSFNAASVPRTRLVSHLLLATTTRADQTPSRLRYRHRG